MNELMNVPLTNRTLHRQLLATASAMTLLALICGANEAKAEDADRPVLWIELGGQLEHVGGQQPPFVQPFTPSIAQAGLTSPTSIQHPPPYAVGGEGSIQFEPKGTDWIFSAAVRYGRSNAGKHVHEQTYVQRSKYLPGFVAGWLPVQGIGFKSFADTTTSYTESHTILDFQAGKDVGLGMFGNGGTSVFGFGVRFAQFNTRSTVKIAARPNVQVYNTPSTPGKYYPGYRFHNYYGTGHSRRSFHGVGPSITWNASAPLAGSSESEEFTFDWGLNAALLFGRQKVEVDHRTAGMYVQTERGLHKQHITSHYTWHASRARSRSTLTPNLGGFAGVSLKFPNAKVSLGYRADLFLNAMDTGIDTRETSNVLFHGPFATISVGLGG